MPRFLVVGAAGVAGVWLLAACASGSPHAASTASTASTSAHAAFVASVTSVCERAVRAHQGHEFPVSNFDPLHPDASTLPAVGDYFADFGQLDEVDRALHALRPPPADAASWAGLVGLVDRIGDNSRTQIRAARARDVATFVATVRAGRSLIDQLDTAGVRFGFHADTACVQVIG